MHRFLIVQICLLLAIFSFAQPCSEEVKILESKITVLEESNIRLNKKNIHLIQKQDELYKVIQRLENELSRCSNESVFKEPYSTNPTNNQVNHPDVNHQRKIISNPINKINLSEKEKIANLRSEVRNKLSSTPTTLAQKINLFNNQFDTYIIDLRDKKQVVKFLWKDSNGTIYSSLNNVVQAYNQQDISLTFAINGGMYDSNQNPQGLLIQDGITKMKIDRKTNGFGNFYLKPNGVFLINKQGKAKIVTTEEFVNKRMTENTLNATQSGPMLIINGAYHSGFNPNSNNRKLRNGVGVIDENRIVFAISKQGVTFYEFARLFKEVFNCDNAMFLDGGVSKMYCPDLLRNDNTGNFGTIIGLLKY